MNHPQAEQHANSLQPLTYAQFSEISKTAKIIDTRVSVKAGLIHGAINITFKAPTFDQLVQSVVALDTKIVVIADPGLEEESVLKLIKSEYNHVEGFLQGGFEEYKKQGGLTSGVTIVSLADFAKGQGDIFLDVRSPDEWQEGIFPGAICIPFYELQNSLVKVPKDKTIHVYCMTGGRAKIGASILRNNGYNQIVITEQGGLDSILAANNIAKSAI